MKNIGGLVVAAAGLVVLSAACTSSGVGGRKVEITQKDDGCSPTAIAVTPGEKLNLVVKNASSSDAYEVEGIEGTNLEEFVVHKGKTLSVGYTIPEGASTHKVKCYVPAGKSTIIELIASGESGAAGPTQAASVAGSAPATPSNQKQPDTTVAVGLASYTVTPDKMSVKAGAIRFVATNTSKDAVHELAVLKIKGAGSFENMGEIEDIAAEQGGSLVLDLAPGVYRLACLIAPGEAGSQADHYQQGMHTDITVE